MAARFRASSNAGLISHLKKEGIVSDKRVEQAMLAVDRADFCRHDAYQDRPQDIGFNVSISAPHMHAFALQYLCNQLQEGAKALDVGSGTGYLTACMAVMVGAEGRVIGIEHMPQLVDQSISNISQSHGNLLKSGRVRILAGDGRQGHADEAPYDVIHVGAACPELPLRLIDQLKVGGRLIAPVGRAKEEQVFVRVTKNADGSLRKESLMGVVYVPLTDRDSQLSNS